MKRFRIWAVALAVSLAGWAMAAPASAASIAGGTGLVYLDAGKTATDSLINVRERRCGRNCLNRNRASNGPRRKQAGDGPRRRQANNGPRKKRASNGPPKRNKARRYSGNRKQLNSRRVSRHGLNRGPRANASRRANRHNANKRGYNHKRRRAHSSYSHFRKHCRHKSKCGRHKHRHGNYKYYYSGWFYAWPWWTTAWPGYAFSASYYDYGGYGYNDPHVAYCLGKYRSYRPDIDRYLSYSGVWRRCISPYS